MQVGDRIGRTVDGRYRLRAFLGAGGTAQVFLADDIRLRRPVAVKLLHDALIDDEAFLRRLAAEAQAAANIQSPHVVVVHDWGPSEDGPYIATEYLAGGSLAAMLAADRRLTPSQMLQVALHATSGLAAAHEQGLVHRDIKPANLLFDESERLRVADFGLVRAISQASLTEPAGPVMATARYAAPEVGRVAQVGPEADVYALVLTLVEAVSGLVPLTGETPVETFELRRHQPVPMPASFGPAGSVLFRAGAIDPADRPTAEELHRELLGVTRHFPRPDPLPLVGAGGPTDDLADPTEAVPPEALAPALRTPTVAPTAALTQTAPTAVPGPAVTAPHTPASDRAPLGLKPPSDRQLRRTERRVQRRDGRRRRFRRLAWQLGIATVLVTGVVVAAVAVSSVEGTGPPAGVIGTFLDRDIGDVRSAVGDQWILAEREVRSAQAAVGTVVAQDPEAGVELELGETISVDVVVGPFLVLSPRLDGLTEEDALTRLEARNLTVAERIPQFDEIVPAGSVISASVEGEPMVGGLLMEPGTAVALLVSDGPAPREVPVLAGLGVEAATEELAGRRLVLAVDPEEAFSEEAPVGAIVAQSPDPGTSVARDSTVTVVLSKGPDRRAVPDLNGLTLDEATAALEAVGLVRGDVNGSGPVVTGSDPVAGVELRPGTEVALFAPRVEEPPAAEEETP